MKTLAFRGALAGALAAAAVFVRVLALSGGQPTARLSGVVLAWVSESEQRPLGGAIVRLGGAPATLVAVTDASGWFAFEVPEGTYRLGVERAGYLPVGYGESGFGDPGLPLALRSGEARTLTVALRRGGSLSGAVRFLDGYPAPDVPVFLDAERVARTVTDHRGEYRICCLPPAEYVVSAMPLSGPLMRLASASSQANDDLLDALRVHFRRPGLTAGDRDRAWRLGPEAGRILAADAVRVARIYYPGTPDVSAAQKVTVAASSDIAGLDFTVSVAGSVSMSGRVVSGAGAPAPGVRVVMLPGGSTAIGTLSVTTDVEGRFAIDGLAPALYRVVARMSAPAHDTRAPTPDLGGQWAEETVDLRAGRPDPLTLILRSPSAFSGRVAFRGGSSAPAGAMVQMVPAQAPDPGGLVPRSAPIGADGAFAIARLAPGDYRLAISGAGAWFLESAVAGGRDLLGVVRLRGSEPLAEAVLAATDRPTELHGRVSGVSPDVAAAYTVVVFPAAAELWDVYSTRISSARIATDGTFRFRGLPPGDYRLGLLSYPIREPWQRGVLEQAARFSVPVKLAPGQSLRQDLRAGQT